MLRKRWKFLLFLSFCITFILFLFNQINEIYHKNYPIYIEQITDQSFKSGDLSVQVNIDVETIEYKSLGEDLLIVNYCNGNQIYDGSMIPAEASMNFITEITEIDSIPDKNSGCISVSLPPYSNSFDQRIKVCEVGSTRYPNAYAIYKITYRLEPVIDLTAISYLDILFLQ